MKAKILFIDDHKNILESLRLSLRSMQNEWDMSFAPSGAEGLDMFDRIWPDVVVTDMRMPNMDGTHVLRNIQKRKPDVGKIILSGYSDKETVIKNIQLANEYLSKPCKTQDLIAAIRNTLRTNDIILSAEIKNIIAEIETIPSSSAVYESLIRELENDNATSRTISKIISQDVALAASIIRIINCTFFNFPKQVKDIEHAVRMLGSQTLLNIIKSSHLFDKLKEFDNSEISIKMLWEHSLRVARLAKLIAANSNLPETNCNDCVIASMFHDIGKFIFASKMKHQFSEVLAMVRRENCTIDVAERCIMGASHAEVGAYLLARWGFSHDQITILRSHHDESVMDSQAVTPQMVLYVADSLDHELVHIQNRFKRHTLAFMGKFPEQHQQLITDWRTLCQNNIQGVLQ
jgi:putative nucleotidyltransferase with HDIG domain